MSRPPRCDVRQFHAACPPDGPAWAKDHAVCLLMTHQGLGWLDKPSREGQYSQINPAGRFAVHLVGHMHEEIIRGYSQRGGAIVRHWQGNSLFGLEHYGDQEKQDRRHGYSAGTITFEESGAAVLRHWPSYALAWSVVPISFLAADSTRSLKKRQLAARNEI